MKNGQTTLMLLVLCLASLAPMMAPQETLSSATNEQDTSGRAAVDFTVIDVSVGNTPTPAETWDQPDGTSLDYMLRGVRYEVKVTFNGPVLRRRETCLLRGKNGVAASTGVRRYILVTETYKNVGARICMTGRPSRGRGNVQNSQTHLQIFT